MFDRKARKTGARGSSLVEFSLCMPLLLMIFSAAAEYGSIISARMGLQDAAREGARWAAKGELDQATRDRVGRGLAAGRTANPTVVIEELTAGGAAISPHKRTPGSTIRITVTTSKPWLTPLLGMFGHGSCNLSSSAAFRVENS